MIEQLLRCFYKEECMKKSISKVLTLMLSFAMVFTSIGWLGSFEANAAEVTNTLSIKVVDQDGAPVPNLALYVDNDDEGAAELGTTTGEGTVSHSFAWTTDGIYGDLDEYTVSLGVADAEKWEITTGVSFTVVVDGPTSGYIETVNGAEYDGSAVTLKLKAKGDVPVDTPIDYVTTQATSKEVDWPKYGIAYADVNEDDFILDVRPDAAWYEGHVNGATHVNVALSDATQVKDGYVVDGSALSQALDAAYEAAGSKRIVVVCVMGQTLAARTLQYFNTKYAEGKGFGEDTAEAHVTYLKGGATNGGIPAEKIVTDFNKISAEKWDTYGIKFDAVKFDDFILDVRPDDKWEAGRLADSVHANVALSDSTQVNAGYVVDDSALAGALDEAYEAADGKRIVVVCNGGQTLAKRAMEYLSRSGKDMSNVTYLIGGAGAFPAEGRVTGAEKARTMTTSIDMSKYPKGKVVKVWVPVPQTEDYQVISNEKFEAKTAKIAKFTTESVNGNKMLYLEWAADAEPAARKATLSFDAKRVEAGNKVLLQKKDDTYPDDVKEYITKESEFVKVNDPIVQEYAAIAAGGKEGTLDKAKAIYEWETANLERIDNGETLKNSEGETRTFEVEGCGYGDTVKILTDFDEFGRAGGHCTDLNSTFVALCRANGIPAREMFGIRMNDDATGGQHCWAEFYLPGTGWVFADPGDALKAIKDKKEMTVAEVEAAKAGDTFASKKAYFWGTVDNNRIVLSRGRDVVFNPPQAWGACNTFGYPAAEVGGERNPADFTDAKNFVYSIACTEIKAPAPTPAAPAVKDGQTATVGDNTYTVTSASAKTAAFTKAKKSKKSATVPATINVNGVELNVTSIAPKAFKGTKVKTLTVKSKKLTKKSVKGSLKGSKVKTVKVKVGKKKENKKYVKKYKKIFTKKNCGKKVKVK